MVHPLNINTASAAELVKVLGLSKSKSTQIVNKHMDVERHCFSSPNAFAKKCYMGVQVMKMRTVAQEWVDQGLVYFGPPGILEMPKPKAMPQPVFTPPRGGGASVNEVERSDNLIQGEGAVGYGNLLMPRETPMELRSAPLHPSLFWQQTLQMSASYDDPALTELKWTYSADQLHYIPPVPPRMPLLGQSARVQTSPEVLTADGGMEVQTRIIQTSPRLMAWDEDLVLQQEHQLATERIQLLEQQLVDKDVALAEHQSQAAVSSRQMREMLLQKDKELEMQAQASSKHEQEVEVKKKQSYDTVMEDWAKEYKKWWGEQHQQEERWKREREAWE